MQIRRKQSGFTIIELVVVILLLGILAATALPRFINVTDEAHQSVFEGTSGAFATGVAMVRAEWIAGGGTGASVTLRNGDPISVTARTTGVLPGYPQGTSAELCLDAYTEIMQTGAPTAVADTTTFTSTTTAEPTQAQVNGTTGTGDFRIIHVSNTAPTPDTNRCYFLYVGQYSTHAAAVTAGLDGLPFFYYDQNNGDVVVGNTSQLAD